MTTRRTWLCAVIGILFASLHGCLSTEITGPGAEEIVVGGNRLRLDITLSSTRIERGKPHTVTLLLTNLGDSDVRLDFGSSCQVMPYVRSGPGDVVVPQEREWGCFAIETSLSVPAGATVTREHIWYGHRGFDLGPQHFQPLAAGIYYLSARAGSMQGILRSGQMRVRILD